MLSASEHCQRGLPNPLDELPEPVEPTEYFFGEWLTKSQFIDRINEMVKPSRALFVEEEHDAGVLYLSIAFSQKSE